MSFRSFAAVLGCAALLAACSSRKVPVALDLDVYLHPETGDPDDLLLQTAVRKRLRVLEEKQRGIVHVRVVQRNVFLSGTVKEKADFDEAEKLAAETAVEVNGQQIKPALPVRNAIQVSQ